MSRKSSQSGAWFGALVVAAVVSLSACSGASVDIREAVSNKEGTVIDLSLARCGREYAIELTETDEAVTVGAIDQDGYIGIVADSCQDSVTIDLAEPLGDRPLIDGANGQPVEVWYFPWNGQRFSEDEYRAAMEAALSCYLAANPGSTGSVVDGPYGPEIDVDLGDRADLSDGETWQDPGAHCIDEHVDPLRR